MLNRLIRLSRRTFGLLSLMLIPMGFLSAQLMHSIHPGINQLDVSRTQVINSIFNQSMNAATVTSTSVHLNGTLRGTFTGPASVTSGTNFQFAPDSAYLPGEVVTISFANTVATPGGVIYPNGYQWSFTAHATGGNGTFTQRSSADLGVGATGVSITSGDFDHDGDVDCATLDQGTNSISILKNNGLGVYTVSTFSTRTGMQAITSGDFDHDGDIDLAVTGGGASGVVAILKNDGTGAFTETSHTNIGIGPQALAVGDLDGDGDLDLAVAENSVGKTAILLNDATGVFTVGSEPVVGSGPSGLAIADLNSDGIMDIVVSNYFGSSLTVLLGNGNGTFTSNQTLTLSGSTPQGVVIADLDEDGFLDVAAADRTQNKVFYCFNNGSGTLSSSTSSSVGTAPTQIVSGDCNGDGFPDLITTNSSGNSISYLRSTGAGNFASAVTTTFGSQPWDARLFDADGDGDLDVALLNRSGNSVFTLVNAYVPVKVVASVPGANALNVSRTDSLHLTFSRSINPSTLTSSNIVASGSLTGRHVETPIINSGVVCSIAPSVPFAPGEVVTLNVSHSVAAPGSDSLEGGFHAQFTASAGVGPMTFISTAVSRAGTIPWVIAAGDIDGDGDNDAVVCNLFGNSISIFTNNGTAAFTSVEVSGCNQPAGVIFTDFDRDGDLDIAVANAGNHTLGLFKNNGSGSFSSFASPSFGNVPVSLAAADFDGDGIEDIAMADQSLSSVSILHNDGSGNFSSIGSSLAGSGVNGIAVGDFNNDGYMDVAIANLSANTVSVLLNNGDGTFASAVPVSVGGAPNAIAAADFNGDGFLDLAVTSRDSSTFSTLMNNGDGSFARAGLLTTGETPVSIATGDLDGDCDLDLVVISSNAYEAEFYRNNGSGAFSLKTHTATNPGPGPLCVADLDGDLDLDILVITQSDDSLFVLRNSFIDEETSASISAKQGWNLISLPVVLADPRVSTILPSAVSAAYAYTDHYITHDSLTGGVGYWLKVAADTSVELHGLNISPDVSVHTGWNLLGTVAVALTPAELTSSTPGLTLGDFFGYSHGYAKADTLYPGKGYWVKANMDGVISFPPGSVAPVAPSRNRVQYSPDGDMPPSPPSGNLNATPTAPARYNLAQNYPNPFNPTTTISFAIPTQSHVTLEILNVLGQRVALLENGELAPGTHQQIWNGNGASGVYYYRLQAVDVNNTAVRYSEMRRMILMK